MSHTTTTTAAGPFPALAPVLILHPLPGQLARFVLASGMATAINIAVYLVTRTWWDALPANLVALFLSTALSTELNRRFTFGHTGARRWAYYAQTVATVVFYAFYSSAVLLVLHAAVTETVPVEESVAVTAASLLGGGLRFVVLRRWVFQPSQPGGTAAVHTLVDPRMVRWSDTGPFHRDAPPRRRRRRSNRSSTAIARRPGRHPSWPRAIVARARTQLAERNGLRRQASAPSAMACSRPAGSVRTVMIRTGRSRPARADESREPRQSCAGRLA